MTKTLKLKPGCLYKIKNVDWTFVYDDFKLKTSIIESKMLLEPNTFILFLNREGSIEGNWSKNQYLYNGKLVRDSYRTFCFPEAYFVLVSLDELEIKQGE